MIEHVFVLMFENRSFDHMLGFSALSGTDASTGQPTTVDGLTGSESNQLPSGARVQVAAGADYALPADQGHGFSDVVMQLCGEGATYSSSAGYPPVNNSGFAASFAAQAPSLDPVTIMRGFRPDQLPVMNALAAEFAVCDRWFSSLPGPTWPNRLFVHAASSAGLDDSPTALQSIETLLEGYKFTNGTIYDRLDSAGLGWHIVEGDALPPTLTLSGMVKSALSGRFLTMSEFAAQLSDPGFADHYVFIEPSYGHVLADGSNFKCGNSMHPLDDVTRGEQHLKDVYELIRNSPHWEDSLLIVIYDEHGGFFDHVAPPEATPPNDTRGAGQYSQHNFNFDRLGVRVPALVISPHTPRGLVDHSVHDHSSVPATLERLYGLQALTERDRNAEPVNSLIALSAPRNDTPTKLPAPAISGIPDCEEEGTTLAATLETSPPELSGVIDSALTGFVHVAVMRDLHLMAAASGDLDAATVSERARLAATYGAVRTKFQAVKYIDDVEQRYWALRKNL